MFSTQKNKIINPTSYPSISSDALKVSPPTQDRINLWDDMYIGNIQ